MYKTILVPLDGSERAEAIMPHVEEMARRFEAAVVLLIVVESHDLIVAPTAEPVELSLDGLRRHMKDAEAYVNDLLAQLREKAIEARCYVEHGPVVEKIIDVSAREDADLIAIASHGRSGLARVFYGSVAAGVLQRVDRPLLLIRAQ